MLHSAATTPCRSLENQVSQTYKRNHQLTLHLVNIQWYATAFRHSENHVSQRTKRPICHLHHNVAELEKGRKSDF